VEFDVDVPLFVPLFVCRPLLVVLTVGSPTRGAPLSDFEEESVFTYEFTLFPVLLVVVVVSDVPLEVLLEVDDDSLLVSEED
jgi:hypothetical protein